MLPPVLAHRIMAPNTAIEESTAIGATTEMIEAAEAEVEAGEMTVEIEDETLIAIIAEIGMIEVHRTSEMSLAESGGVVNHTIGPEDQTHQVELVHHHMHPEIAEIHSQISR